MTVGQGLDEIVLWPGSQEPQERRLLSSVCFRFIKKVSLC